jgi:hypothetical protein
MRRRIHACHMRRRIHALPHPRPTKSASRVGVLKREKRPTIEAKETYYRGKRDLLPHPRPTKSASRVAVLNPAASRRRPPVPPLLGI